MALRGYAPLPFTPATPFTRATPATRNIWFGNTALSSSLAAGDINATACPGSAAAPAPTAGQMCAYPLEVQNLSGIGINPGITFSPDIADKNGFFLFGDSVATGNVLVRYVWAYKAP